MSIASTPLVSICLPNLNSRQFLEARMDSLLAQTLGNWELIVCDSYSDDGSWEFLRQFEGDPRIRLYQVPREGLFAGWNECLKRVTGKYVYIATSDDTSYPHMLAQLVGLFEQRPDAGVAVGQFDFIDSVGRIIPPTQGIPGSFFGEWQQKPHFRSGWLDFLVHTQIGTSWTSITSVMFVADFVRDTGLFRMDVSKGEAFSDRFWAMKIASIADTVYTPEKIATWRVHPGQASKHETSGWRAKNLRMTEETIRECEPRIPADWKRDQAWLEKLLFGMRQYYYEGYGLDRECMRTKPKQFLKGLGRALVCDPKYLRARIASGFSWRAPEMANSYEAVRKLIQEWNVPWPPVPLSDTNGDS
jgi:glycosyltransferase involved in cell wall biosynthesis